MKIIIVALLTTLFISTAYATDKISGNVFIGYDRPIPKPEKKPRSGND